MKLFISCGGKGERLYPLTKDIPKPMIEIEGKPVLEYIVDWAKQQGIESIVMLNGYKSEKIVDYFKDGEKFGIRIDHSNETSELKTGGAIKFAEKYADGRIAYVNGDSLYEVNLKKMSDFHEKNNSVLTAMVTKSDHPFDCDSLEIDKNYRVKRFVPKQDPNKSAESFSNSGLFIIEKEIFGLMDKETFTFETYIFPRVLERNLNFFAYYSGEQFLDMGTAERLENCSRYIRSKRSER